MNQSYSTPYDESEVVYREQAGVTAPQFPQQLQVPTTAGAKIPAGQLPHYPTGTGGMGGYPWSGMGGAPTGGMGGYPWSGMGGAPTGGMGGPWGGMGPGPGGMGGFPGGPGVMPLEQSYVENILRLNLGKRATVYMTYENNPDWNAMIYRGILDEAGRDHIVLRDPATGKTYLLLMVNLDYVEFDEPINYVSPTLPSFIQTSR